MGNPYSSIMHLGQESHLIGSILLRPKLSLYLKNKHSLAHTRTPNVTPSIALHTRITQAGAEHIKYI